MKIYKRVLSQLLIMLILFIISEVKAINIDSLEKVLQQPNLPDTQKVRLTNVLAYQLIYKDITKAERYAYECLNLIGRDNRFKEKGNVFNTLGMISYNRGNYNIADSFYTLSLQFFHEAIDTLGIANAYNNLGLLYQEMSWYDRAIEKFHRALEHYKAIDDYSGMATVYLNIGVLYYRLNIINKAIEYHLYALNFYRKTPEKRKIATCLRNLGGFYFIESNLFKAIQYTQEGIDLDKEIGNKRGVAIGFNNLGDLYASKKQYDKAIVYYEESLKIRYELNEKKGITVAKYNLALSYKALKNIQKAIILFEESLILAKELNYLSYVQGCYEELASLYAMQNRNTEAYNFLKQAMVLKDSLHKEEKNAKFMELQAKMDADKKQNEIELLKVEKQLQQAEIKKKQWQNYALFFAGLAVLIVSFILWFAYNNKRKSNQLLLRKNVLIETQNEEIRAQRDHLHEMNEELEQQKEEISAQRDEIDSKNKKLQEAYEILDIKNNNILGSLRYAQQIQSLLLVEPHELKKWFNNSFVLSLPKDLVSGDFYYVSQIGDNLFFALFDCTGHGVPGALMSIYAHNLIEKALHEEALLSPDMILDYISKQFHITTSKQQEEVHTQTGMDVILCRLHLTSLEFTYCATGNIGYVFSKSDCIKIAMNHLPIGHIGEEERYKNTVMQLQKNDIIYLSSDGFADQFNHESKLKYTRKRLQELISGMYQKPLEHQAAELKSAFLSWKGESEQIDDVLVLGLKV